MDTDKFLNQDGIKWRLAVDKYCNDALMINDKLISCSEINNTKVWVELMLLCLLSSP